MKKCWPAALILAFCACRENVVEQNYPEHPTAVVKAYVHNFGFKGLFASEGTRTVDTRADQRRVQWDSKFTGSVAKHFLGPEESLDIVRLDKDLIWTFNVKKKTYVECPVSGCAVKTPAAAGPSAPAASKSSPSETEKNACSPRIVKNRFIVKPTGEARDINGFQTTEYQVDWNVIREDEKKRRDTSDLTLDLWTTPESNPDVAAVNAVTDLYSSAYLEKSGIKKSALGRVIPGKALEILKEHFLSALDSRQRKSLLRAARKLRVIKGYPISTKLEWYADFKTCGQGEDEDSGSRAKFNWQNGIGGMMSSAMSMGTEAVKRREAEKMKNKPVFGFVQEIQSLKVEPRSDGLFVVPPGYKLVNRD